MDGRTVVPGASTSRFSVGRWIVGLLLMSGFAAAGCGSVDEETNPCLEKSCDFGVCDPGSGTCTNAADCSVASDCIPGFECSDEGTCEPLNSCEQDGDCETGRCRDGGCVNPESCSEDGDCLDRTYCASDGTCEPDPCNDVTCQRGVCEPGTDRCVSKSSCTEETELLDCVSGEKCAEGDCLAESEYCDGVTCDRGVCSFEEGGCVETSDCSSDDECLAGRFCTESGGCQPNLCEQNDIDCGDRGTCRRNSGECENAESCESSGECVAGHVCVEGTCRLESSACGDAIGDGGCPGNQTCSYDPDSLEATCQEPDTCVTSVDCTGDRRCGGESCLDPETCRDDGFEDNDAAGDATTFADAASDATLSATVCSGNSDFYSIETTNYLDSSEGGTLVVDVDVPERDRGLGAVEVEVFDSDANSQGMADTGAMGRDGRARFTKQLMSTDHGEYTVEVSSGSDVGQTGVSYDLSVDVLRSDAIDACADTESLPVRQRVSGTTESSASSQYGSTCTSATNSSSEKIYTITVDRPQELTFELEPRLGDDDLSMSLRRRCSQLGTELACSNGMGAGGTERIERVVGPGTYELVVQSPEGESGGPFDLFVDRVFTTCSPDGDFCDASGMAHSCASGGGTFDTVDCANACNPTTGSCLPPAGDVCGTAETIDPNNAQTRTVPLNQATDQSQIGSGSCIEDPSPRSGGPDVAYEVSVPRKKYVRFEATFERNVEGSMYLVGDCSDVESTCAKGVQGSTSDQGREVLEYANASSQNAETFFLVVDTAGGQDVSTAELDVHYEDVVCDPPATQCGGGGAVEACSGFGTAFEPVGECSSGCNMGVCSSGTIEVDGSSSDSCSDARDLTALARPSGGHELTGSWADFTNDYEFDETCGGGGGFAGVDASDTDGADTVWRFDLGAGEVLRAALSGDGAFSMYLKESGDCGTKDTKCPASVEEENWNRATVEYEAPQDQTVYLVADRIETVGGTFTLDVNIENTCSPTGSATGCAGGNLEYCTRNGFPATFACGAGCSNAGCDGDTCSTAPDISADAGQTGGTTIRGDWAAYTADYNSGTCGVFGASLGGEDHAYEMDVPSGEGVEARLSGKGAFTLYVKDAADCDVSGASCKASVSQFSEQPVGVSYTNSSGSTERLAVIADRADVGGGTFELDVNVAPTCSSAGNVFGCAGDELEYCNPESSLRTTYSCEGGCSSGSCGTPTGDICPDAKPMTDGDSDTNRYAGSNYIDPVAAGATGSCDFGSLGSFGLDTGGADRAYEVTLADGEEVSASYSATSTSDNDVLYILKSCGDGSTCQDAGGSSDSVTYENTTGSQESVYVIADHDSAVADPGQTYTVDISIN